jgi:hypothetical protein
MQQIFIFSILKTFTKNTFITFFFLVYSQQLFAQVIDNFDDSDFLVNPAWSGNTTKFSVTDGQLKLQAPAVTDAAYLSVPSRSINDASWQFYTRLAFNSSSTNYARVYLASSRSDLSDTLKGYFVMIGNTADDISLYKQSGSTRTKIIDGTDSKLNAASVEVKVKVTRDATGNWQLYSDVGLTGNYTLEGSATDAQYFSSAYFGVYCNYTATRSDKFYFDDFIVTGNPYIPPAPPTNKDVIFTEIFADPSPRVELPEVEYLEIYNRSSQSYNLAGWKLTDGTSVATLPSYTLAPGNYLILLAASSATAYNATENILGLNSFPSLNNSSDKIVLKYKDGLTIDSVHYADSWYKSDDKKEGGWSLELIDPANICGEENNWTASENETGGTPGKQNSVVANKPDLTGPKLLATIPVSTSQIVLQFDEKLSRELPLQSNLVFQPSVNIASITFADESLRSITVSLNNPLFINTLYTITGTGIYDCNGNVIQSNFSTNEFALPEEADSLDVKINELLFNPRPTGTDFIEIVNTSEKFLNLKGWSFATFEKDSIGKLYPIADQDILLKPGAYLVLTEDADILKGEYPQTRMENVLQVKDIPALSDDAGTVAVVTNLKQTIDHFSYSKNYHSVFIKDEEGVSLERISFTEPTNDRNNWKSASTSSGYATPGFLNSNSRMETMASSEDVVISPEIFIPGIGQPDFTEIQYKFNQGGYVANVKVFDASGRMIKELANNALLGTEGFIRWDGDREDGSKARIGYYMVWFEVFDTSGTVRTFRKRLAVASRF